MHADFHITCFLYLTYLQNLKFVPQISILNSFFWYFSHTLLVNETLMFQAVNILENARR